MKQILFILATLLIFSGLHSQYYYKDLVILDQSSQQWKLFKNNKIRTVKLSSFEGNEQPSEGFSVEQKVSDDYGRITTSSQTLRNGPSQFISFYNPSGQLTRTIDTSEDLSSTTVYQYNSAGQVSSILNTSSSSGQFTNSELHSWVYNSTGKPERMTRIRNGSDTTIFTFLLDEKGNVIEERGVRKGVSEPTTFYYYDDKNRLTDIVRFSVRANRLLPTNIFTYDAKGMIAGMLLVPEGSNEYQRWYYDYDERGFKTRERVYDKQQQLLGKIEFIYQ